MGIDPVNPPAEAMAAVHRALSGLAARSAFFSATLRDIDTEDFSISTPHCIAYLHLRDIHAGVSLRKAVEVGRWRFLVHKKQRSGGAGRKGKEEHVPVAAATVDGDVVKGYELTELNEGPFVEGTENAIHLAEEMDEVRAGRFEPVLLVVPALYVAALWLLNRNGDENTDILLIIPPSNPALVAHKPTRPNQFIDILHRLALKMP